MITALTLYVLESAKPGNGGIAIIIGLASIMLAIATDVAIIKILFSLI